MIRCSEASLARAEPMVGSAPRADTWVVVEHPLGWGEAPLARTAHGVRVLMARGERDARGPLRVWVAHPGPHPALRLGHVDDPAEVAGWDLARVAAGSHLGWGAAEVAPLLLVCANGRRDRCCGHLGGRLADQLRRGPHGARVLTSTHLGGHRFAPTALLLPWGVLHGRLELDSAADLIESARNGRTPTASLRGYATMAEPAQVAEARARSLTGYDGLAPLPVQLAGDPAGDRLTASVTVSPGSTIRVPLERTTTHQVISCTRSAERISRWAVAP